jgi:hypothetical protein
LSNPIRVEAPAATKTAETDLSKFRTCLFPIFALLPFHATAEVSICVAPNPAFQNAMSAADTFSIYNYIYYILSRLKLQQKSRLLCTKCGKLAAVFGQFANKAERQCKTPLVPPATQATARGANCLII